LHLSILFFYLFYLFHLFYSFYSFSSLYCSTYLLYLF
jgi:hypothetical protein